MHSGRDRDVLRVIKDTITRVAREEGVEIRRVILFGSRARGDYGDESDWDLLIVIGGSLYRGVVRRIQNRVYRELAEKGLYCDVIIVSEEYYIKHKDTIGTVAYYANLEGVPI